MTKGNVHLALDLGTTTLAGQLIDPAGNILAEATLANPQKALGSDVIRRLEAALQGEGRRLQQLLLDGLESLIEKLLRQAGRQRPEIAAAAAAANPAISYLLRGLPVESILYPPHRPPLRQGVLLPGLSLSLPVPLYLFPLVSGYVGGDLVAFLFSLGPQEPGTLCLDIGTNGEMALFIDNTWRATSVAAGPAFEGGEISSGMMAQSGAVAGVRLAGDSLELRVIGGAMPRGICGSGLVEAIAAARAGGLVEDNGSIVDPLSVPTNLARLIVETPAGLAIRLYRDAAVDLLLSQQDIRAFQLAKGAVRAGIECLLRRTALAEGDVVKVFITGAFGFSLSPEVLKRVAMLPENMVEKVRFSPDGVLAGLRRFLVHHDGIGMVQTFAASVKSFPLSGTPVFEKAFLRALDF